MASRGSKKTQQKDIQNKVNIPYNVMNNNYKVNENVKIEKTEYYVGPLPHPKIMSDYNNLVENGAERIFSQFEKQTNHRIKLENRGSILSVIMVIFAFILILSFLFAAYKLALLGHNGVSVSIVGAIAAIIAAFYKIIDNSKKEE